MLFSVREGARLQSFPDWFTFCGTEGSQFNQIGNAVPPLLAKSVALSVRECLRHIVPGDHLSLRIVSPIKLFPVEV